MRRMLDLQAEKKLVRALTVAAVAKAIVEWQKEEVVYSLFTETVKQKRSWWMDVWTDVPKYGLKREVQKVRLPHREQVNWIY